VTLDQNRIAEFVRSIAGALESPVHALQRRVINERAQQLMVARTVLVGTRNHRIDHAQSTRWPGTSRSVD
jgi:hypothetical protein